MVAERLGEPSDAAAEVERRALLERDLQGFDFGQELADLLDAGLKELVEIPAAVTLFRLGEDGPERVDLAVLIPVLLKVLQIHRCSTS